jgi:hypothetical protein
MTKHILPMKVGPLAPKKFSFLPIIIGLVILAIIGAICFGIYKLVKSSEDFCGCDADLPNKGTGITVE